MSEPGELDNFLEAICPGFAQSDGSEDLREVVLDLASGGTITYMGESNVFYYGDNLSVMREMPSESVDLIYLDPPFNSQRTYNMFFKERDASTSEAQRRVFDDYWRWGDEAQKSFDAIVTPRTTEARRRTPAKLSETMQMLRNILRETDMMAYLVMMAVRLIEMRRLLKPTGSLYLHCDPTASHYLKLLLDCVFGPAYFRNEVIWKRSSAHSGSKRYSPVHDVLLFYGKSQDCTWNVITKPLPQKTINQWYNNVEPETGRRFNRADLTASGTRGGLSGKPWRGIDPTTKGRHWAIPRFARGIVGKLKTQDALDALDAAGRVFWPKKKGGIPMFKRYLEEAEGVPALDVITDIAPLNNVSAERLGYPTQKPIALLKLIVEASTNEGDVVLDPFCGCGTTIEAAQELGRRWIGVDITHVAVSVLRRRLEGKFPDLDFRIYGEPQDFKSAKTLALAKPHGRFEFQAWMVDKIGGVPVDAPDDKRVAKRGGDGGIDGWLLFRDDPKAARSKRMVLSVKSDVSPGPEMVRELLGTVTSTKAAAGALLLLHKPTPGMLSAAKAAGTFSSELYDPDERYDKIQILSVADLFKGKTLKFPGWNSTRRSVPPAGLPGTPGDLFEWAATKPLKKAKPKGKGIKKAYPKIDERAANLVAADSGKKKG